MISSISSSTNPVRNNPAQRQQVQHARPKPKPPEDTVQLSHAARQPSAEADHDGDSR